ncbi:hypothetical protein BU25DRAFT_338392, partial [Macroventuria anomochaeta]
KMVLALAIDWLVAFMNLVALLSVPMFVTRSQHCYGATCAIMKIISTVLTTSNFTNWAATATVWGIRISKSTANVETLLPPMDEEIP